jgi:hypothetical protein
MIYLAMWAGFLWGLASIIALAGGILGGLLAPFGVKPRWLGILALPAGFAVSAGGAVSLGLATAFMKGPH